MQREDRAAPILAVVRHAALLRIEIGERGDALCPRGRQFNRDDNIGLLSAQPVFDSAHIGVIAPDIEGDETQRWFAPGVGVSFGQIQLPEPEDADQRQRQHEQRGAFGADDQRQRQQHNQGEKIERRKVAEKRQPPERIAKDQAQHEKEQQSQRIRSREQRSEFSERAAAVIFRHKVDSSMGWDVMYGLKVGTARVPDETKFRTRWARPYSLTTV